ncbi:hypothetical protein ACQ4LF_24895, partial [Aeromonas salmonicida]
TKLSSMFDPFVRIGSPSAGKGYGLGLAITRKAIQAQGGRVEARNGDNGGLVVPPLPILILAPTGHPTIDPKPPFR